MNRVTKRAGIMLVFVLLLVAGVSFFVWEFFTKSDQWVTFTGSPHVYENSSNGSGVVTIAAETANLEASLEDLLEEFRQVPGVIKADILAG